MTDAAFTSTIARLCNMPTSTPRAYDQAVPLSPRQAETLRLIADYVEKHGYPPSLREIALDLGVRSTEAVRAKLRALQRYGKIKVEPGKARGLRVLDISEAAEALP